ncbi:MAG: class I SAM-dependent methyltransferase [Candidatus Omnitrophica bacterium]|nr:class I SAM-dependent methyltransferase [Candidatus Omnitrophota bacterium]
MFSKEKGLRQRAEKPKAEQTKESFDFQWETMPKGRWNLENEEFRREATGYVCQFTALPAEWFKGKKALDAGCGGGRYSWALCKLGADVLSIDQSAHGLKRTKEACKDFPGHRVMQADLLKPLNISETFDLVWCYGVLHHTGDTYGAFKRITPLVRKDGFIFLMIYGEPRKGVIGDYAAVNEYEYWRRKTRNMTLDERLGAVKKAMREGRFAVKGDEYIEGYFDAISPLINDLYRFEEIENWLLSEGFCDIRRTVETRNHHIVARKGDGRKT